MARFRLLIEYDGSRYHGWQQNAGVKTIQGEMMQACGQLFNTQRIEIYGAGRTDAGVHALGQVAHLDVPTQMHTDKILSRLNEMLPFDIHILSLEKCDPGFHARHSAVARSYVYCISRRRSAFGKPFVWWVKEELSVGKMQDAAYVLKGFHDFASFGTTKNREESTRVDIRHLSIADRKNMIFIHVIGSHFLWGMVRRIAGVLVHAGKGRLPVKHIEGFLQRHSERPGQLTAPPSGLYLQRVYYPGESFDLNPKVPVVIVDPFPV